MLSLTPDADQSLHCSDFARSINLSPAGTAIKASVVVVIDTPLPWPKPVFEHQLLVGLTSKPETEFGPGRILASVPQREIEAGHSLVRTFWRSVEGTMEAEHRVRNGELVQFMAQLAETGQSAPKHETARTKAGSYSLVCTQGSHDICCGGAGMRYAAALEQSELNADVVRVSHTGGHRFAPTALTFPDGRMWAYLTSADAQAHAERSVPTNELADKCRGWWGASTGPGQVAEIAVWSEVGWQWDDANDRQVVAGSSPLVEVSGMGRRFEVEVSKGRQVPTIACNKPGGQPIKIGQEWDVIGLREL